MGKIINVQDLIKNKEKIQTRKIKLYDLEIPDFDTVTIKQQTMDLIMEAQNMESNSDQYIIYETFVSPNLKDKELQKEFECTEPTDIVNKIFKIGEIAYIGRAIMECAGFNRDVKYKLHEELKN